MNTRTLKSLQLTWLLTALIALVAFGLYCRALAPSVTAVFDDSLEFALVVHRLGIAHPTGYPLYILLGKAFSLFCPANTAFALNLMSAVFAALTVALLYRLGLALSPATDPTFARHAGATLGALLLGLGPVFFSQSLIAEVYTLNAALVAAALLAATRKKWLPLAAWLGLGLAHHRSIVLLFPALALFAALHFGLFNRAGWQRLRREFPLPKAIIAFAAPLLLYLYLPLRGQIGTLEGDYLNTPAGFWRHIAGGGYGTAFLLNNPFGQERTAPFYAHLLQNEQGWIGLVLAGLGLLALAWREKWASLGLTGAALLTYFGFNLAYAVADIEVFFIPVFMLLAVWAGLGLGAILARLGKIRPALMILAGLAALMLVPGYTRIPSRAGDWTVYDYGRDTLASAAPNSTVVGIQGQLTLLRYLQETGHFRQDVATFRGDTEPERRQVVADLLAAEPDRPVYLLDQLGGAAERWSLNGAGPLIRVNLQPVRTPPPFEQAINAAVTPEISLPGYTVNRVNAHLPNPPVRLTLVWQVNKPVPAELKVSARLLDSAGATIAAVDKTPVNFAYPTTAWRPGEFITDVYDLPLPANLPAGNYTPLVILYDPAHNAAEVGRVTLWDIVLGR